MNHKTLRKIILPLILLVIFASAIAILFFYQHHSPQKNATQLEKSFLVNVITAKPGRYTPQAILYGTVESPDATKLEAAINADVTSTPAKEGHYVKKGQLLMALDAREAKINLQQRDAEVADLKAQIKSELSRDKADKKAFLHEKYLLLLKRKEAKRLEFLLKKQVGSESQADQSRQAVSEQALKLTQRQLAMDNHQHRLAQLKARLLKAKALQSQAKLDLERTKIYAPFTGRITKINVAVGNRVQAGEALIELFNTATVEVRAQIPSPDLATIKKAIYQGKTLYASATVDRKKIKLKLQRLAGFISAGQGGVDGLFTIINDGKNLAQGRILELHLTLPEQQNVVPVPPQAIYKGRLVYTLQNQRMQALQVNIVGEFTDKNQQKYYLIQSPALKANDVIITTHLPNARSGLKVKVVKE